MPGGPDPVVSIVMPAFNRERFVAAAIDSVLSQTFTDWELLIIDDGSSDETPAIAGRYVERDGSRIHLIRQPNRGVTVARNTAIRRARGRYIAFLDSDDLWMPAKLDRQLAAFDAHPDAAFIYTGYVLMNEDGTPRRTVRPDRRWQGDIHRRLWLEDNEILGPTVMVATAMLSRVGLFDEALKGAENLDLRLKLSKLGPVFYVDDVLYRYRKHPDTLTSQAELMDAQQLRLIEAHFGGRPLDSAERRLQRAALSKFHRARADRAFAVGRYDRALGEYLRGLGSGPVRARGHALVNAGRCLIGARGNAALRRLKGRRAS
jgi:glycosyltransferase involved in cell wall biosynthesis